MITGKIISMNYIQRARCLIAAVLIATVTPVLAGTVTANFTSASTIPVTAASYTATGNNVTISLGFAPPIGTNLTIVKNTGLAFISGQFSNLAQGQVVNLTYGGNNYRYVANYYGGTGNDLVLQWGFQNLAACGDNGDGQLGNNSTTSSSVPVLVTQSGMLAGKTVVSVATGFCHSLALCSDGTVAAWGYGYYGQLGNNSMADGIVPVLVTQSGVLAGKTVVSVAAGYYHSLALCSDGTVAAWGYNVDGQLGNNSTVQSGVPVLVTQSGVLAGKTVISVATGYFHSLALCSDGTVAAWGLNTNGQLGNNTTTQSSVPVLVTQSGVLSGKTVVSVAVGYTFSLALCSDGTLAAWGYNAHGELGNGNTTQSLVPVLVTQSGVLAGKTVVSMSAGYTSSLALCSDGTLAAWGANSSGQLGINSLTSSSVPVIVNTTNGTSALYGKTVTSVATGMYHNLAVCSDGTLAAWGNNYYGQLGNGNTTTPVKVPILVTQSSGTVLYGKTVVSAAAGGSNSLALAAVQNPSNLANLSGLSLSSGTLTPSFDPATTSYTASVTNATTSITVMPTVVDATATIKVNGATVASGTNSAAILLAVGTNSITTVVTAQDGITTLTYTITMIRAGGAVTANFTSASTIPVTAASYTATGNSVTITLGFAPPIGTNLTIVKNTGLAFISGQFSNLAQGQVVNLTYGGNNYCYVANYYGGTGNDLVLQWGIQNLVTWGSNGTGELGNGSSISTNSSVPVLVTQSGVLAGKTVVSFAAGYFHSLVLCSDGTAAAWGSDGYGELGNISNTYSTSPVLVTQSGVLAGKTMVSVAAGTFHSLALCSDGTVSAWGWNANGQLGNNSLTNSNVPVSVTQSGVLVGKTVVSVAAGYDHSLALCSDGTVVAWGDNYFGQLGNNSTTNSSVPVLVTQSGVLAGKTVVSVAAGAYHSLAMCSDGTVAAWGNNSYGQLGNNSTTYSSVPVQVYNKNGVLAVKTVVAISAENSYHSMALCSDGTLAAWGDNSYGELGNNSTTNSSVPVLVTQSGVLAGKTVVSVAAGNCHSLALCSDGAVAAWGDNSYGELGNNSTIQSNIPVLVTQSGVLAGQAVVSGAAGGSYSLVMAAAPNPTVPILTGPATSAAITDSSATLGGNVTSDGGAPITERGIVYSLTAVNADPQIGGLGVTRITSSGSTGVFTLGVTGLSGLAGYSFKAYAINGVGIAYTTPASAFTTLAADLSISVTADPTPVTINGNLTYAVQVNNAGSFAATGVSVSDILPPTLAFVSATVPAGWTASLPALGSSGQVSFAKTASMAVGATATITIVATVRTTTTTGTNIENSATASTTRFDSNLANNTASTSTLVVAPDLSTSITASLTPVPINGNLTYTIQVKNVGSYDAKGVSVSDTLPPTLAFVSATAPAGWVLSVPDVGSSGLVSFSDTAYLTVGDTATITIVAKVRTSTANGTNIVNAATASTMGYDPNLANNTASTSTLVVAPDLSTSITASPTPVPINDNLTYTIQVINNGTGDAPGVNVSDILPPSLALVSATLPAGWTSSLPAVGSSGLVSFNKTTSLAVGDNATITIVATVRTTTTTGTFIANTATASTTGYDPNLANNTDSTITLVVAPDLSTSIAASPTPVPINNNLTYSIQVINNGTSDAPGASVRDILPPTLAFVSVTAPSGWTSSLPAVGSSGLVSFNKTTSLAIGGVATFTVVAMVRSANANGSIIVNSATASTTGYDLNLGNNTAAVSTPVGTVNPTPVQLASTATLSPQSGLFKLVVNVTNTTPLPINGFRLHVDYSACHGAYPSLRLYNASSPSGSSDVYVDYPYPVAVDGTVPVDLEFYTSTRTFPTPFLPVLTVEMLASSAVSSTNGSGVQPNCSKLANGTVRLEFASVTGHWYRIRYSSDMVNWFDSPVPILAGGTRTQWTDTGAPLTNISPADPAVTCRFYLINEINTP